MAAEEPRATILNVDDDEANRYASSRILRRAGYDVVEAATGEEALAKALEQPDLVLLDVRLPDIHGFEVCRRLRQDPRTKSLAIVHLTAHARESADRASGLEEGADGYITQPVRSRELLATVEAMLRLRRAERRSAAAAREWKVTFDAIPDAICVLDGDGRIERCNSAMMELVGLDENTVRGRDPRILLEETLGLPLPPLEPIGTRRDTDELAAGGRWFDVAVDPLLDAKGEPEGAVLVLTDITDRKMLEGELRDRARALEIADERKDEFLAMLAHELRTPLGALRAAADVMEELEVDTHANPSQKERVFRTFQRQIGHLSRMVDDLLDVSRITQGKVVLRRSHLDLRSSVRNAAEALRGAAEASRHELVVEVPDEPLVVWADSTRVEQVVTNLVDNAIKYTPQGGRITVTLESTATGMAELRVVDTGAGIAPGRLSEVFQLFVQFDRTLARARGGLGLGLTLVRRLVEMHEGEVDVTSEGPGKGSTFFVRLPVAAQAVVSSRPPPSERRATMAAGRRLLLVEDDDDLRQLLAWKLRRRGFEVQEASNGSEALETAGRGHLDAGLIDLGLPGMDGLELARELRRGSKTRGMRLIALTGYGAERDMARTREAGFDDHLVKPVDVSALLERLEAAE